VKQNSNRSPAVFVTLCASSIISALFVGGCASDSQASKGAAQGAGTGALAGAASGLVGALVFGGDPVDAAARGAVYGGTAGAVAGGISGSRQDKAIAASQQDENEKKLAALRKDIGDDAFNGVVALAECKYEVAAANAKIARQSKNKNYALAGLWVDVLSVADQRREDDARAKFPELIKQDRDIKTDADAESAMREGLQALTAARRDNGLPAVCG
jgi:hypothetical protein